MVEVLGQLVAVVIVGEEALEECQQLGGAKKRKGRKNGFEKNGKQGCCERGNKDKHNNVDKKEKVKRAKENKYI